LRFTIQFTSREQPQSGCSASVL